MELTRREFLIGSAMGMGFAALPVGLSQLYAAAIKHPATAPAKALSYHSALCRIGYGPTPQQLAYAEKIGLKAYLEEQLHPRDTDDTIANNAITNATLHIEYKDGDGYKGLSEDRPLSSLTQPTEALWHLSDNSIKMAGQERNLPADDVRAATWLRAVYSTWQLREVMVEFWHNHFNVNAYSNPRIAVSFPAYDALMHTHCFGNFRDFLGDVARSPAMLYFLNNDKSRASPANENYARELFELHTLGAGHYYNNIYNRWREVPGAVEGRPIGYIDQDVYEAARSFTGWTVEDGSGTGHGNKFPQTGKFIYYDGWHDNYQKRVLGTEFDPNAPPMADGNKVLDLVAAHPGTAINLSTKLCRRFVSDNPPDSLIKRVAGVWLKAVHQPDQIAQVLRTIILSPEFAAAEHEKVKRPFELVVSFLRATGAQFMPVRNLFNTMGGTGYRQFEWASPTGHPDTAEFWLNTNSMLGGWNLLQNLTGMKTATLDTSAQTPESLTTPATIAAYWYERLTGRTPAEAVVTQLSAYLADPQHPTGMPARTSGDFKDRLNNMVTLIAMLPDFQWRG